MNEVESIKGEKEWDKVMFEEMRSFCSKLDMSFWSV